VVIGVRLTAAIDESRATGGARDLASGHDVPLIADLRLRQ
jgi:hypothetical protein